MRRACISVLAIASLGPSATLIHGQSPAESVEDLLSYYIEGGALWRQDNPNFRAGSSLPAYWIRQLRWGPSREVVIADALAVSEDGRCESVAHIVYFWDTQNRRVAVRSFNAGGVSGEGYFGAKGPSGVQLITTITLPDGSVLRMREHSDNTRSDVSTTHPERLVDDAWVAGDSVTWRREKGASPCGGEASGDLSNQEFGQTGSATESEPLARASRFRAGIMARQQVSIPRVRVPHRRLKWRSAMVRPGRGIRGVAEGQST